MRADRISGKRRRIRRVAIAVAVATVAVVAVVGAQTSYADVVWGKDVVWGIVAD